MTKLRYAYVATRWRKVQREYKDHCAIAASLGHVELAQQFLDKARHAEVHAVYCESRARPVWGVTFVRFMNGGR